ncbi:Gas vesicle synthesis protein GvpL/GvpF [Sinosporangium album]|uniref:Gas vesicle synthesis protein GvpL/GvpF n=1 Tax=Sinosporangium album TaxID=504805 RepID=A0A1G7Z175_9ACTN|nr:GvpL/GvpF family gas vesicle protein [Sinosporangium album]SDH02384.1 Gas vesicle synthesis protein GvpL/GvpF [Sinosporangium album]
MINTVLDKGLAIETYSQDPHMDPHMNAHERLLDETSLTAPVLPFRFGAVTAGPQAIVDELLTPHHDESLTELSGAAVSTCV